MHLQTDEYLEDLGKQQDVVTVTALLYHFGITKERQNNDSGQRVRQIAEKGCWTFARRRKDNGKRLQDP